MKSIIFSVLFLVSWVARADILGISDGVYRGSGTLHFNSRFVPGMGFTSTRILNGAVLKAFSQAKLGLGTPFETTVVTVRAKLLFISDSKNHYQIFDLEENRQNVGEASCDESTCTFEATIMGGDFYLKETWVKTQNGFRIENGSQIFKKLPADYDGEFSRL